MNHEDLIKLQDLADDTLRELMDILNHRPHLAAEIKPLVRAEDIMAAFRTLAESRPDIAEQLLRMSLATLVNYPTSVEVAAQLARGRD